MYLIEKTRLTFDQCFFIRNYASEKGGTAMIVRETSSKTYTTYLKLNNTEIAESKAEDSGGTIYMEHDRMMLYILGCNITKSYSMNGTGGVLHIASGN